MNHIAMFMHGGVAPPESPAHVPAITGLVKRLSEQFDITVYLINGPPGSSEPFLCGKAHVKFIRPKNGESTATLIFRALRAFRADHRVLRYSLVHGFWALPGGLAALMAGKLTGVPHVVSLLGGEPAYLPQIRYGNMIKGTSKAATLWACRHASALTLLTRYQLHELERHHLNRTEDIHIIPFGADDSLFHCSPERPTPPPYHFLHVGHANSVKDQATLLRAFRRISRKIECRLRIIGEDKLGGSLQRLTRELDLTHLVTFEGFVRNEDLQPHFAWAHMLLHSSLYEGQGVVFAEAAASGVLICGTRVGLLSDLGESAAVTVMPGDDTGLAEAILEVIDSPVRMDRARSEAKAWANQHNAEWTAARYSELYQRYVQDISDHGPFNDAKPLNMS